MKRYMLYISLLLLTNPNIYSQAVKDPFPIQYSIPASKVVKEIPQKTRDFSYITPLDRSTYIYEDEESYYKDYQSSYFAVTCKKAGWDCMRHYEILANGCIPYFLDIDNCPPKTMAFFPRELIKEAMNLEGVSYLHIDHSKFNKKRYYEILDLLLEYTRNYLTCNKIAEYLLKTVNYSGGKVLLLTYDPEIKGEYLRDLLLIGLRELLGDKVVDVPKISHIYTNYPVNPDWLWGKGFSYAKVINDIPIDRTNIGERIKNKEFEIIIFARVHNAFSTRDHDFVSQYYKPENIVYLCPEEFNHRCQYAHRLNNLFIRECL